MPNLTKTYHFKDDAEGWTPHADVQNVVMSWRRPHRADRQRLPEMGGCIRTTQLGTIGSGGSGEEGNGEEGGSQGIFSYWQLATTWQSLGIPEGVTVQSVQAEYQYRWDFGRDFFAVNTISAGINLSGPFLLHDANGGAEVVLANEEALPQTPHSGKSANDRSSHWPPASGSEVDSDYNWFWQTVVGPVVGVPNYLAGSDQAVKFRLHNRFQEVAVGGERNRSYLRLRQDRIVLNVTFVNESRRFFIV